MLDGGRKTEEAGGREYPVSAVAAWRRRRGGAPAGLLVDRLETKTEPANLRQAEWTVNPPRKRKDGERSVTEGVCVGGTPRFRRNSGDFAREAKPPPLILNLGI